MKKGLMLLIVLIFVFSSCKYYNPVYESSQDDIFYNNEIGKGRWIWDDSLGEECGKKVMRCFIDKDSQSLKNLLCNNIQNTADIDSKIEEAFGFIDGNIISYDDSISCGSGESYDSGELVVQHYEPFIDKITTDTGKTYVMNIVLYTVCKENEGYVGVTSIVISDEKDSLYSIGGSIWQ